MILQAHPRLTFGLKTFGMEASTKKTPFDSIFVLVKEIYDEIYLTKAEHFSVVYFDKDNNEIFVENDLVSQAVLYLETYHSVRVNLQVRIKKNVPLFSGLASLAACAAALIKYYADHLELPINFFHLATKLNTNVPFFLTGFEIARVQNLGDQVSGMSGLTLPPMKLHFTNIQLNEHLVNEVHKTQKRFLENNYISKLVMALTNNQPFDVFNEYEPAIFNVCPELFMIHAKTKTRFNQVFPSGCGSTLVEVKDPYFEHNQVINSN